jgi:hypothetical protein
MKRFPKGHDQSAGHNQYTPGQNGRCRELAEKSKIDDLPHDEQGGDIKADHLPKFQRRQIEKGAIARQQSHPEHKQAKARPSRILKQGSSDHGVS